MKRFKYVVESNGISITEKKLFSVTKRFVSFENVGSKIIRDKERKLVWLITSFLFFLLAIIVFIRNLRGAKVGDWAEVFWLLISLLFFVIYAFGRKSSLFLVDDSKECSIEFIGTKIYERRLDQFIKDLIHKRDNYLQSKYPVFEGLTQDEIIICSNAATQLNDGLFLKQLTKHTLKKLILGNETAKAEKLKGICSVTTEKNARKIIKDHQDKFISEGKFIFISDFLDNEYYVGILATTADPYEIMKYAETKGSNYNIETKDIIEKYKKWDNEFGIRPVSIGSDFCECEIKSKNIDYKKLAIEVYEFCPDVVDQGTETVELLEAEIKRSGRIFLWWD